jgi:hypothetical protein
MDNFNPQTFDKNLAAALSSGREISVPGFADRVIVAVRLERRRQTVIRWSSLVTTVAACVVTVLTLQSPSEESLNRQTVALVAREESSPLADLLGIADDLSLLTPVVDKKSSIVDVLATPGS